jgi:hypothetical protein
MYTLTHSEGKYPARVTTLDRDLHLYVAGTTVIMSTAEAAFVAALLTDAVATIENAPQAPVAPSGATQYGNASVGSGVAS